MTARQDVVILGAPRSGTNMLRDVLSALPGFATWPCDEINYIWRHGHITQPTDELSPHLVTDRSRRFVRRAFDKVEARYGADVVVEKTCANTLRVPFVEATLKSPFYVFIIRDGFDAIASARQRWTAPLDLPYLARKSRYVPATDLPYYAARYGVARLARLTSADKALPSWGPVFEGMRESAAREPLLTVCARQWRACVTAAARDIAKVPDDRVITVRYEDFVADPQSGTSAILAMLHRAVDRHAVAHAVQGVRNDRVGKGKAALSPGERDQLATLVDAGMAAHGY